MMRVFGRFALREMAVITVELHSQSTVFGKEKYSLPLREIDQRFLGCRADRQVTIPTELFRIINNL